MLHLGFTDESGIRVGIVGYATIPEIVCHLDYRADVLLRCIDEMVYTRGRTDTAAGILTAITELAPLQLSGNGTSRTRVIEGVCG